MASFNTKKIITPEFDYNLLMSLLSDYRQPWSKIRMMLKHQEIIRVKKGLYIKSPEDGEPYSEAILANMIYGPSYLSGAYALSWHGMIPEGVVEITSVSIKPNKTFETPVGTFRYKHLSRERYATGFTRVAMDSRRSFFIATPEKAIVDNIFEQDIRHTDELLSYLTENLRMEEEVMRKLDVTKLRDLAKRFRRPVITCLLNLALELST